MLKDNIKTYRKSKRLSQEELALKLNVVRQTISKWEQGLSVPDAEMLIRLSEVLEVPVNILLGESAKELKADDMLVISEKLEMINLELSKKKNAKRKGMHCFFILICIVIIIIFVSLFFLKSFYLNWDYNDPENAVLGVVFHSFEWGFIRIAPLIFIISIAGIILTRKKS